MTLELLVLRRRPERSKDLELVVLCHELSPDADGILQAKSLRKILTPAPATGGAPGGGFGFGVGTGHLRNGQRFINHTGANRGWSAIWAALPAKRAGLVVLTNSNTGFLLYADASCEWSRAFADDIPQECAEIAGGRSFLVRGSAAASVVLLLYLASVAASVLKRRRAFRRPVGLRWTRVLIFPLLALVWFVFWHTTLASAKITIIGLDLPLPSRCRLSSAGCRSSWPLVLCS